MSSIQTDKPRTFAGALADAEARIKELEAEVAYAQGDAERADKARVAVVKQLAAANARVKELQSDIDAMNALEAEHQAGVDGVVGINDRLKRENAELKAKIKALEHTRDVLGHGECVARLRYYGVADLFEVDHPEPTGDREKPSNSIPAYASEPPSGGYSEYTVAIRLADNIAASDIESLLRRHLDWRGDLNVGEIQRVDDGLVVTITAGYREFED